MYRISTPGQLSFENFYLPFGGKLSGENRWVKLAEVIPWEQFEPVYAEQFSAAQGAPAKPFRFALGALVIKERLGISDEETIEQIRENPYLQYFLGLSEYSHQAPFDATMLVQFRKRITVELISQVNEAVAKQIWFGSAEENPPEVVPSANAASAQDDNDEPPASPPVNQGQLIVDATCTPADIRYPRDLDLLNEARAHSERIIDELYQQVSGTLERKPRTYRNLARKAYLTVAKKRKPTAKEMRKGIGKQLNYLRRNLAHIDALLEAGASLAGLTVREYRQLLVIHEVFRQQQQMYQERSRRIDDRIVSIAQPHVRPIVRGKAGKPVEFGAKVSASCIDGCVFLDHLSWDNFNESGDLIAQIERFRDRFGHYPASVHADQIYRNRANRDWCKANGIRLSGLPLGRPSADDQIQAQLKQQTRDDEAIRVAIEGKFGQGKRRFSLARVMPKLAKTAETSIAISFLVMNLERWLHRLFFVIFHALLNLIAKANSGLTWAIPFSLATSP